MESQESFSDYYSKININREVDNDIYDKLLDFYDINKLKYGIQQ